MDQLRLGLVALALAPVAWLVGVLIDSGEFVWEFAVMAAGLALVAWACPGERPVVAGFGFAAAALAVAWFYDFALFVRLPSIAGGIVVVGFGLAAVASWVDAPRGAAIGLSVVAVGGLLWVYVDGAAWEWQVGNVLTVVGAVVSSLYTWWKG